MSPSALQTPMLATSSQYVTDTTVSTHGWTENKIWFINYLSYKLDCFILTSYKSHLSHLVIFIMSTWHCNFWMTSMTLNSCDYPWSGHLNQFEEWSNGQADKLNTRAEKYNASLKLSKTKLSFDISTFYFKCLIDCQDQFST